MEQYLQYEIEPPVSLPKMQEQYKAIMAMRASKKKAKEEERIHQVLNMWKRYLTLSSSDILYSFFSYFVLRRVAWWNEDVASPEAGEAFIMHAAEFGKGIDEVAKKLAEDWLQFEYGRCVSIIMTVLFDENTLDWTSKPKQISNAIAKRVRRNAKRSSSFSGGLKRRRIASRRAHSEMPSPSRRRRRTLRSAKRQFDAPHISKQIYFEFLMGIC